MAVEISSGLESVDLTPSIDFLIPFCNESLEIQVCLHNITRVCSSVLRQF